MTNDMTSVIVPKSDQLNADDLLAGPRTITITNVSIRPGTDQPISIFYEGDNGKPYKCCKSMARVLVHQWGPDASKYVGRSLTLYCDPKVTWGGMAVGGIRISHMSHIEHEAIMALTATKGQRKPFIVKPLVVTRTAQTPAQAALPPDLEAMAREAANNGLAAYQGFYGKLNKAERLAIAPIHEELKAIAAKPAISEEYTDVEF